MAVGTVIPATRVYDKGDRRHKHVGRQAEAYVDQGNPKKVVGKCPKSVTSARRDALLQSAIPMNPSAEIGGYHKYLCCTHKGVIYKCATSDMGVTYHAFPFHGLMRSFLVDQLRAMPDAQIHQGEFERWVDDHIKVRG